MRTVPTYLFILITAILLSVPNSAAAQNRKSSEQSVESFSLSEFFSSRSRSLSNWFRSSKSVKNRKPNSKPPKVSPPKSLLPKKFPSEHRAIDGHGNNVGDPERGAAGTPFLRSVANGYSDGSSVPGGGSRPSARLVSNEICTQLESIPNGARASDFLWQWGQFLDHDIDETPGADPSESFNISVPVGDPFFDPFNTGTQEIPLSRSSFVIDSNHVRQQVNGITSYIDASNVYGSDEERAQALRTLDGSGKLKTSGAPNAPMLPFNEDGFPNAGGTGAELHLAGDVRANEQLALTVMHTLFVREHNFWAEKIGAQNSPLSGDEIYEQARTIVAAEMQAITYNEFLPLLLGKRAIPTYRGYNSSVDSSISNLFAAAAYRVGHTMLSPELQRLEEHGGSIAEGSLPLQDAFFSPQELANGGIDPILRGLASQPAQQIDTQIIDAVRNFLFGPPGAGGFDLASLNIQRGREHGLPDYSSVRAEFGLSTCADFSNYSEVEPGLNGRLQSLYGSPGEMDPWIGLLGESHAGDALVGETLRAIMADQFIRLRDGDRFWYQNYLSRDFQQFIDRQTLAVIIRRNTNIKNIQDDVFRLRRNSGHPDCPVRIRPDEYRHDHMKGKRKYFGPDMSFGRRKDYGFGKGANQSIASIEIASPVVNGSFSVEVNMENKNADSIKKSDFQIENGSIGGVSSLGNGRFFATVNSNGPGEVSLSLGESSLTASTSGPTTLPVSSIQISEIPAAPPETHALGMTLGNQERLTFTNEFRKPVVIAIFEDVEGVQQPFAAQIRVVDGNSADVKVVRADGRSERGSNAQVRFFVIEEGEYMMGAEGSKWKPTKGK